MPWSVRRWVMDVSECSHERSYDGRKGALPERIEVRSRLERRRRWSLAAKLAIVRETLGPVRRRRWWSTGMGSARG